MTTYYTKDHEWLTVADGVATVGITDHAQEQLGDVVFVELPDVGKSIDQGGEAAVVESVKAASEVYAPITGEVTEVNAELEAEPAKVNADATGAGWFFKMTVAKADELSDLLDEAAYKSLVESES